MTRRCPTVGWRSTVCSVATAGTDERGQEVEDALAVVGAPDAVLVLHGDRADAAVAE